MGDKTCLRGIRVTVGTVVVLVASSRSFIEILAAYPYLEEEDVRQALAYAAWRVEEVEVPCRLHDQVNQRIKLLPLSSCGRA